MRPGRIPPAAFFGTRHVGGATVHEQIYIMRGLDWWLMVLIADPEFAHALLRKMTDVIISGVTALLSRFGQYG